MVSNETVGEIEIGGKRKKLVVTSEALAKLSVEDIYLGLTFHSMGDWGEDFEYFNKLYRTVLQREDVKFLSVFRDSNNLEYWVMTKNDGSINIMLPTEYDPDWKDPQRVDAEHDAGFEEIERGEIKATFPLGKRVITQQARNTLYPAEVLVALSRHAQCDWGECSKEDAAENELSLREGFRLLSVYRDRNKTKFWIITEADHSCTTVLLPDDY